MNQQAKTNVVLRFAAFREGGIFLFLLLIVFAISLRSPVFLTPDNLYDITLDSTILAIVAVGEMMVILTGGIDISLGASVGLAGMVVALVIKDHWGIPPLMAVLMGTAIGALLGAINGALIVKWKIPPIITTLGTMSLFRGLTFIVNYAVNQGQWVGADKFSVPFKDFARGKFLFIPNLLLITIIVYLVFYYFLNHTMTGRKLYAVGGNRDGATFVGIQVDRILFLPYLFTGMLAGTGGVLWVSRYTSAQTDSAQGFEFTAITAAVLGGINVAGGSGSIWGVLLGSLLIGIINNALNLVRISPFWKLAINGLIILLAVVMDKLISRKTNEILLLRRNI